MQSKLLTTGEQRTYVVVFDPGEEVVEGLTSFAAEQGLTAAEFSGLGAMSDCVLGFFDLERRDYDRIPIREQVEVLTLVGNVAVKHGETKLHPHIVIGRRDGTAYGGHLLEGHARPTLEVMITEAPAHIRRRTDEATGLPLIDLEA